MLRRQFIKAAAAASVLTLAGCSRGSTGAVPKLRLAASVYVGWMPWMYASTKGYLADAGRQANMALELVRGDYVETLDQFAAGHVDAVLVTNVDAITSFVDRGIDCDVVLIGSYSNGNDAILVRPEQADNLTGATIGLVQGSVSQYLLERFLAQQGTALSALTLKNMSDADIARNFANAGTALSGVVTWNPIVSAITSRLPSKSIGDTSRFPREVADMLVVRRSTAEDFPGFAQALLQVWFRIMGEMGGPQRGSVIAELARLSDSSVEEYEAQLRTTLLMDSRQKAQQALTDPNLAATMERVAAFAKSNKLATRADRPWYTVNDSGDGVVRFSASALGQA